MVLPCQETFGPSRLRWHCGFATMTSADFWWHESGYPDRPAFRASLYSRVRFQISPNKGRELSLHKCVNYPEFCRKRLCGPRATRPRILEALMTFLFVTSQLWRDAAGCYADRASQASSPRSVTSPQLPSPSTSS